MTTYHRLTLLTLLAALSLAACGAQPQPTTPPPAATTSLPAPIGEPAPAGSLPDATSAPTTAPEPAAPTPPPGWLEVTLDDSGLALYAPEGWTVQPGGLHEVTLHPPEGDGWAQFTVTEAPPGAQTAHDVLERQLAALRENGDFAEAQPVETRGGLDAAQVSGVYYVLEENLLVGVALHEDLVLTFSGHGPGGEGADAAWSSLEPVFAAMFASLAPAP